MNLTDACMDYALSCAADISHGKEHIKRVLNNALLLAADYPDADRDALTCACLLHACGRREQLEDPSVSHAAAGAVKARAFLEKQGCPEAFIERVVRAVAAHSDREAASKSGIEAILLFDADKLEMTGAVGVTRALLYCAEAGLDVDAAFPAQLREDAEYAINALITPRAGNLARSRASFMRETAQRYESEANPLP